MAEPLPVDQDCVLYEGVAEDPEARRRRVCRFLSDQLGVSSRAVKLSTTPTGQPVVENREGVAVSWAHRSHFLLIGVAKGRVGVDLELADQALPVGDLAAAFFCKHERRMMHRLAPSAREQAFFLVWTLREAYLKTLGHGLAAPVAHELDFSAVLRSRAPVEGDIALTIYGPGLPRAWMISRLIHIEGRLLRLTKITSSEGTTLSTARHEAQSPPLRCGCRRWHSQLVVCIFVAVGQILVGTALAGDGRNPSSKVTDSRNGGRSLSLNSRARVGDTENGGLLNPVAGRSPGLSLSVRESVDEDDVEEEEVRAEEQDEEDEDSDEQDDEEHEEDVGQGEGEDAESGVDVRAKDDWVPGDFSAEVSLVSDYVSRGISDTDHNPAVQGGVSYTVDIGLEYAQPYFGFWGSNVDFSDSGEATLELDYLFGLRGEIADLEWDLGCVRTTYPGASNNLNYDYWEINVGLRYPLFFRVGVLGNYSFSPDYFGATGNAHYLRGGFSWEMPLGSTVLAFEAVTGHQWIQDNDVYGVRDYQDWQIGMIVKVKGIDLGVAYTDTNLSKQKCFGGTNVCEPRAVFWVGAGF